MIELGSTVVDSITNARGLAVGRSEYLHGRPRIQVQPFGRTDNGAPQPEYWIDEHVVV